MWFGVYAPLPSDVDGTNKKPQPVNQLGQALPLIEFDAALFEVFDCTGVERNG